MGAGATSPGAEPEPKPAPLGSPSTCSQAASTFSMEVLPCDLTAYSRAARKPAPQSAIASSAKRKPAMMAACRHHDELLAAVLTWSWLMPVLQGLRLTPPTAASMAADTGLHCST